VTNMSRKLRPLAALALVALISLFSAGCGSNAPSETGTASRADTGGIASGDALLAPEVTRRLIEEFVRHPRPRGGRPPETEELTERELEVLKLIAAGQSNTEIATGLFVSAGTVKTHVNAFSASSGYAIVSRPSCSPTSRASCNPAETKADDPPSCGANIARFADFESPDRRVTAGAAGERGALCRARVSYESSARARLDADPLRVARLLVPLVLDHRHGSLGAAILLVDQTPELLIEALVAPLLAAQPSLVTHLDQLLLDRGFLHDRTSRDRTRDSDSASASIMSGTCRSPRGGRDSQQRPCPREATIG